MDAIQAARVEATVHGADLNDEDTRAGIEYASYFGAIVAHIGKSAEGLKRWVYSDLVDPYERRSCIAVLIDIKRNVRANL